MSAKAASCANIIPGVTSIYEWEGEIKEDSELLLMVKTRKSSVSQVIDLVKKHHPYECPEVIAMDISGGSPEYLQWLMKK